MKLPSLYTPARSSLLLALALLAWLRVQTAHAQKLDSAITIGQSVQVWSETLAEERRIFVYLPQRYAASKQRYPVLYLLDAEEHFHHATGLVQFLASNRRIPELIVVGITNSVRNRDLTPATHVPEQARDTPNAGGADRFLHFVAGELAPWVEAHYRTEPFRILVGHSLGGLINVYSLATRPQDFQAHIAISPSLWWDGAGYIGLAQREFPKLRAPHFLYMACGDSELVISKPTEELASWLNEHPLKGLTFAFHHYAGENHGTTPHRSLYDGLESIYAQWPMQFNWEDKKSWPDLKQVEAHFAMLSRLYGYPIEPTPDMIDAIADQMLERKDYAHAMPLLMRNAEHYPELAYVHETLAKGLEATGRFAEALSAYRRVLTLTLEGEHPYRDAPADYRKHVIEIEAKRRKK